jgi:hypothetical protein
VAGRLIVEQLDGETLVYDTERNEAHALSGAGSAEFLAAEDELSRRAVLRKLTLAGAAAVGLLTIAVPPAAAQISPIQVNCGGTPCDPFSCCPSQTTGFAGGVCCSSSGHCCVTGAGDPVCTAAPCNAGIGGNCVGVCLALIP